MNFLALVLSVFITVVNPSSSVTKADATRVHQLANSLAIDGKPFPGSWSIIIPAQWEWDKAIREQHIDTLTAYTYLGLNLTYLNPYYVHFAEDERLRRTLAHEAGHLSCNCTNEDTANSIADKL